MPITGKLVADFSSFYDAVTKADASLASLDKSSQQVERSLNRMVSEFSGGKVIQQATLAAEAVQRVGGVTTLTAGEQAKLNALVDEAVAKYSALGKTAPDALLSTQAALKAARGEAAGLGESGGMLSEVFSGAFGEFTAAGIATQLLTGMTEKLGEFIEKGKELPGVERSFATLAAGVGQSSDAILAAMRRGTEGTVTDFELMKAANKALTADLPVTAESMGELTTAATRLGKAYGEEATEALDNFFHAMDTGSTKALKHYGIVIDTEQAYKAYAASLGNADRSLTDSQKKLAIYIAAMQQAQEQTKKLGEQTTTLSDLFDQAWTKIGNAVSKQASTLNIGLGAIVTSTGTAWTALKTFIAGGSDIAAMQKAIEEAAAKARAASGAGGEGGAGAAPPKPPPPVPPDYVAQLQAAKTAYAELSAAQKAQIAAAFDVHQTDQKIIDDLNVSKNVLEIAKQAWEAHNEAMRKAAHTAEAVAEAQKAVIAASVPLTEQQQAAAVANEKLGISAEITAKALGISAAAVATYLDHLKNLQTIADIWTKLHERMSSETMKLTNKYIADWQKAQQVTADGFAKVLVEDLTAYAEFSEKNAELAMSSTDIEIAQINRAQQAHVVALGQRTEQNALWYDKAKAEIDAYYEHQRHVAEGTADTIEERMRKLGVYTKDDLDFQASTAERDYNQMKDSGEYTAAELQAAWERMTAAQIAASGRMRDQVILDLGKIAAAMLNAFATGGNVAQAAKQGMIGLGSTLGDSLLKKPLQDIGSKFGPAMGKALGSLAGPLGGAAASLGIELGTKLWDHFFGTAGRDAVTKFATSMGGFDALHTKLEALGAAGEQMWVQLTQKTGKNDAAGAAAEIQKINDALSALSADESKYNLADPLKASNDAAKTLYASFEDLINAGHSTSSVVTAMSDDVNKWLGAALDAGAKIPPGMEPVIEQLITMGKLTDDNARKLLGLSTKLDGGSFDDVMAAAGRYGLQLDALGPKVNQLNIQKQAQQLSADWKLLTSDGEDTNKVMDAMKGKVQDVVTAAFKFGDTIPESMKPMIDSMIAAGKLTDDLGNKLVDDSGINFEANLTDQVSTLVDSIQQLVDALTGGPNSLSKSLETIGSKTVSPKIKPVYDDSGIPPEYKNPTLSPGQSTATVGAPTTPAAGGDITVNVTADGRQVAKAIVPYIPDVVTSKGLNH